MPNVRGRPAAKTSRILGGFLLCLLALGAWADQEKPPGQTTVWDQLMAQQSVRHLQAGAEAFARGDYALATQYFARAVASNPDDYRAYLMFGVANYWSGKVDEAMAAYRQVLKLNPKNAEAHQLLGIAYAWKDDVPNALKEFEAAAALDPNRPDIQMDLGSVYETVGRTGDSLDCLRRAVSLDPKYPLYHYQLGTLYDRLGREQDALDSVKQSLSLYSDFQDALLEQGSLQQRAGDLQSAAGSFKKAVKLKPGDAVARLRLALAHLLQGHGELIADDLNKAFDLTPESEGGRLALSQAYHGSKNPPPDDDQGPLSMFRKNLERIPPTQGATVEAEITRVQLKPYSFETPKEGTSTLKNPPGTPNNAPLATRTLRQFTLAPGTPEQRQEQIQQILSEMGKAMKNTPPGVDTRLGMNITYSHKPTEADQQNVHPVSYEPRRVGNDLGLWVQGTGWVDLVQEAVPLLEQRLQAHPNDMQAELLLGLAHLTLGEADQSAEAFQAALDKNPRDVTALLGMGVARVIGGQDDAALAIYRQVLLIDPKNKTAKDAVKWLTTPAPKRKTPAAPTAAPSPAPALPQK